MRLLKETAVILFILMIGIMPNKLMAGNDPFPDKMISASRIHLDETRDFVEHIIQEGPETLRSSAVELDGALGELEEILDRPIEDWHSDQTEEVLDRFESVRSKIKDLSEESFEEVIDRREDALDDAKRVIDRRNSRREREFELKEMVESLNAPDYHQTISRIETGFERMTEQFVRATQIGLSRNPGEFHYFRNGLNDAFRYYVEDVLQGFHKNPASLKGYEEYLRRLNDESFGLNVRNGISKRDIGRDLRSHGRVLLRLSEIYPVDRTLKHKLDSLVGEILNVTGNEDDLDRLR